MATTKRKKPAPAPPAPQRSKRPKPKEGDYRKSYVRLRTLLDGLEVVALRYYLEGETTADREHRAGEMEEMIMQFTSRFKREFAEECPPGLNNCGGCCVPYPCP